MNAYVIFYSKSYIGADEFSWETFGDQYALLKTISAENLNDVFYQMQGENWSPNGEAREMIMNKGLKHTSMSVGDVIQRIDTGEWYFVAPFGYELLSRVGIE